MKKMSRRSFLKATAFYGGAAAAATILPYFPLSAQSSAPDLPFPVEPDAVNPLNIGAADVEASIFEGGFGVDYAKNAGAWMETLHPDVKVSITGIQRVGEVLRPRFV